MNRRAERLGDLLPGVLADLAARHGIQPPTTLTDRRPTMKFRKKPVEVDVMGPLTPENRDEIAAWCHGRAEERPLPGPGRGLTQGVVIHTLEGDMRAAYGDYVIRGAGGEVDVCKPDVFAATYEPVDGAA